jgi:hypothetical protein
MRKRKSSCILQGELGKAIKGMGDKKGTGDKDVSGDVLRLLVQNCLRLMTTDQKHT